MAGSWAGYYTFAILFSGGILPMCNQRYSRRKTRTWAAVAAGLFATTHAPTVLAYLDPGTGSIILQGLLAGLAAAAAAGSIFWKRIKSAFSSLFARKDTRPTEPSQDSAN